MNAVSHTGNAECFRCGHPRTEAAYECQQCHAELWCPWDAACYLNPLTRISLGQSPAWRDGGTVFVGIGLFLLVAGLFLQIRHAVEGYRDPAILGMLFIGFYALYEIRNFFHGHATTIDNMVHEPRPQNTWWRAVGLLGDGVLLAIAINYMFDLP